MLDVTDAVGLGPTVVPEVVPRVAFVDLNRDGWVDVVVNRHRVFLNTKDSNSPIGRRFAEIPASKTGLQEPLPGTATVFADLDNDGQLDALVSESCQTDDPKWKDPGRRTRWYRGRGDGTFMAPRFLPTPPRPTIAIGVGDVNRDGKLDVFFANSYKAGDTYEGFPGDLLMNLGRAGWTRVALPGDDVPFDEDRDLGPRPTYGAMIATLDGKTPGILELSYGRRWNRFWTKRGTQWHDDAPKLGLDGDANRTGVYPDWLLEYAKMHPQFPTKPEKPFRANGNTFDASVNDVDGDGRFDVFLSEITHAWAGDSSDRSRLLFQAPDGTFATRAEFNVDRIPTDQRWNQGDLFSELVDMDCDGLVDLLISSGDYPDQHLHFFKQFPGGGFVAADGNLGVVHDGSQQISLGDIDRDGAPDLIVGQTFFRLNTEQIGGRSPHLRVLVNRMTQGRKSFNLRLTGDGKRVNRDALGAIVKVRLENGSRMQRELVGIGGHAGKQHDFVTFFGLGDVAQVKEVQVCWPDKPQTVQTLGSVSPGDYELKFGERTLRPAKR